MEADIREALAAERETFKQLNRLLYNHKLMQRRLYELAERIESFYAKKDTFLHRCPSCKTSFRAGREWYGGFCSECCLTRGWKEIKRLISQTERIHKYYAILETEADISRAKRQWSYLLNESVDCTRADGTSAVVRLRDGSDNP